MFLFTTFVEPNFRDDLHEVDPIHILKRLVIWLLAGTGFGFIGYYKQSKNTNSALFFTDRTYLE